jgi:hypothetical protein
MNTMSDEELLKEIKRLKELQCEYRMRKIVKKIELSFAQCESLMQLAQSLRVLNEKYAHTDYHIPATEYHLVFSSRNMIFTWDYKSFGTGEDKDYQYHLSVKMIYDHYILQKVFPYYETVHIAFDKWEIVKEALYCTDVPTIDFVRFIQSICSRDDIENTDILIRTW